MSQVPSPNYADAPPGYRQGFVRCLSPVGFHRMAFREWGDPTSDDVVVCVHGLTRVGADFDSLAAKLSSRFRVVCPDIVGRGASSWLRDPNHYQIPQYVADCVTLIASLRAQRLQWVGTSMGGLIGMSIAALEDSPIDRLVLNDVGPVIKGAALKRIGDYLGLPLKFTDFEQGLTHIRAISAPFGPHNDDQWRKLAADVLRQDPDSSWRLHYDPAIALPFKKAYGDAAQAPVGDTLLWPFYDAIRCPTLAIRGQLSDLLTAEDFAQMGQRGPIAECVEVPGVGHAPTLLTESQIAPIESFLKR